MKLNVDKLIGRFIEQKIVKLPNNYINFPKYKKIALVSYVLLRGNKYKYIIRKSDLAPNKFYIVKLEPHKNRDYPIEKFTENGWGKLCLEAKQFERIEDAIIESDSQEDLIYYFE